jgi:hypothetical protein
MFTDQSGTKADFSEERIHQFVCSVGKKFLFLLFF